MTSSLTLNNELFAIRDHDGIDIIKEAKESLNSRQSLIEYLHAITAEQYALYLAICLLLFAVFRSINLKAQSLLFMGVALLIVYIFNELRIFDASYMNTDLLAMLLTIDKVTGDHHPYIYLEPDFIRLFADHLDIRKFAVDSYDKALHHCDLFMNIYHDISMGVERCDRDIDVASDLMVSTMNFWSEIDFNLPLAQPVRQKFHDGRSALQLILVRAFREMQANCTKRPLREFGLVNPKGMDIHNDFSLDHVLYL